MHHIVVASTTKIQKWKQITTWFVPLSCLSRLLPVRQRYKNESKSQLKNVYIHRFCCCCQYDKDTKMKANHNIKPVSEFNGIVVASTTKIQKWKQITTAMIFCRIYKCCCQYDKDTKMKANHNTTSTNLHHAEVVASTTKIQKWKQITTINIVVFFVKMLLPVRQRYKNESKSQQVGKQCLRHAGCCQYDKDTKMKANHNFSHHHLSSRGGCCQYDKDTKMKANHNVNGRLPRMKLLLPVRQRYKNESKSQLIVD